MNNLTNNELYEISGGGIKIGMGTYLLIGGIGSFIIGFVNGLLRPLTCSSSK